MEILIVANDKHLAKAINHELETDQYEVSYAADGNSGLKIALKKQFDLIVLDCTLPKEDGLSVLKKLRKRGILIPILMLTADYFVENIVLEFSSGANACVPKSVDIHVLIARMKALLRRSKWDRGTVIKYAHILLDPVTHKVWSDGKKIQLSAKEYDLLVYFIRNPDQVVTKTMIAENVWDYTISNFSNIIDVYINFL
jgi:DNA-binding response OmpR family regulator